MLTPCCMNALGMVACRASTVMQGHGGGKRLMLGGKLGGKLWGSTDGGAQDPLLWLLNRWRMWVHASGPVRAHSPHLLHNWVAGKGSSAVDFTEVCTLQPRA